MHNFTKNTKSISVIEIKIYNKRGNQNYKEKKLLKALRDVVEKKVKENPNFLNEFKPANDYTELNNLYNKYCIEEASYEDITHEIQQQKSETNLSKNMTQEKEIVVDENYTLNEDSVFIDPLNREEPKVRGYVMDDEFKSAETQSQQTNKTFAEPISFEESFELPKDDDKKSATGTQEKSNKPKATQPINPEFGEMAENRKRKNARKFAKYIVEAVCMLSEKGFVWYATKDINEAKLAEYEINDEMELDLLVSLSEGQEITVKQFFKMQCEQAELLSKFDAQKKQDLADALADVMIEKGVAPTPTQELLVIGLTILGEKAIALITLTSQNNSLLMQLRAMHVGQPKRKPQPQPQTPPQSQQKNSVEDIHFTDVEREVVKQKINEVIDTLETVEKEGDYESLGNVVEKPIETKE
jgi:hypothetical protein